MRPRHLANNAPWAGVCRRRVVNVARGGPRRQMKVASSTQKEDSNRNDSTSDSASPRKMIMVDAGGGFGDGQGADFRSLDIFRRSRAACWGLPQAPTALRLETRRAQHPQSIDEAKSEHSDGCQNHASGTSRRAQRKLNMPKLGRRGHTVSMPTISWAGGLIRHCRSPSMYSGPFG